MLAALTICFLCVAQANGAEAQTARCSMIRDHDSRMSCFAAVTKNSSYCSFVNDHDLRMRCFALLGK